MPTLKQILSQKTHQQLMYYIQNPDKHTPEAVVLALAELRRRGLVIDDALVDKIAKEQEKSITHKNTISEHLRKRIFYQTLICSVLYVGLGTLSVLSASPSSLFYGEWVLPAMVFTLPVNVFSFAIAFTDADATFLILFVQMIVFLIFWLVLYYVVKSAHIKRRRKISSFTN